MSTFLLSYFLTFSAKYSQILSEFWKILGAFWKILGEYCAKVGTLCGQSEISGHSGVYGKNYSALTLLSATLREIKHSTSAREEICGQKSRKRAGSAKTSGLFLCNGKKCVPLRCLHSANVGCISEKPKKIWFFTQFALPLHTHFIGKERNGYIYG